jgi:hypothetical protein
MASKVIVVNSVLGGAALALVLAIGVKAPVAVATVTGIVAGLIILALALRYEHQRLTPQVLSSHGAGAAGGGLQAG